ncbi:MAG: hypothetical protein WAW79_10375 [Steroidobacteraceae bacterium]
MSFDTVSASELKPALESRGFRGGFYAPMEGPSLDIQHYFEKQLGNLSRVG